MPFDQKKIRDRFTKLIKSADDIFKETHEGEGLISPVGMAKLRANARHLLTLLLPGSKVYLDEWDRQQSLNAGWYKGILLAAREDFVIGLIEDPRIFFSAEVFVDFLHQAEYLLSQDFKDPAAVIAGSVLEDGLRKLCDLRELEYGERDTINPLNDNLYRSQAYNKLWHEEVKAKAVVRNEAAHGHYNAYKKEDVVDLIAFTKRFLQEFLRQRG